MSGSTEVELARFVWEARYRDPAADPPEADIADTWRRVARAVASVERNPALWGETFLGVLRGYRLLPGGRILAGAGTERHVTLANCFVMASIEDSIDGIFGALKEGALTIQQGGGIGYDFSTLRPRGSPAQTSGRIASGPVSFMHVWDAMCATLLSTSARGGAMMATLRCDHPDIEAFIDAKRAPDALTHFNLSVLVTDELMRAVSNDAEWPLVFPDPTGTIERVWSGSTHPVMCRVHRVVRARDLWMRICHAAYDCAEPGVLFVDRINSENNLGYREHLSATNPCADEPLPAYGSCMLASLNLAAFVRDPFTDGARLDETDIRETAHIAVRFLDDALELSKFPLPQQRDEAHRTRRIGIGVTALADALAMLGLPYDSESARSTAAHVMRVIRDAVYEASVDLARERGPFPAFDAKAYVAQPFIARLPAALRAAIAQRGIRNSHLLAIAPAGSISLLAGNVSCGIEPIFGIETVHRLSDPRGGYRNFQVTNAAYAMWRALHPSGDKPSAFVDAECIDPRDHLLMQAAVATYVDGSIAKTISLPRKVRKSDIAEIFTTAHVLGLKGCTVFRTGSRIARISRDEQSAAAREAAAIEYGCTVGRAND
ncbi:MAG TPA: adenosylcobalamin-dependent ribonucleoside-diphosphate reductase [Steroidobacteraceae bacterium]|nr:adenosylcobalamin-dependent ribonucleoside-diphosphate reductase [Steroidobacteraceae bacterium]